MTAEEMHIFTTNNKKYKGDLKILKEIEQCAIQGQYEYTVYSALDSFTEDLLKTLGYKIIVGINEIDPWYTVEW